MSYNLELIKSANGNPNIIAMLNKKDKDQQALLVPFNNADLDGFNPTFPLSQQVIPKLQDKKSKQIAQEVDHLLKMEKHLLDKQQKSLTYVLFS